MRHRLTVLPLCEDRSRCATAPVGTLAPVRPWERPIVALHLGAHNDEEVGDDPQLRLEELNRTNFAATADAETDLSGLGRDPERGSPAALWRVGTSACCSAGIARVPGRSTALPDKRCRGGLFVTPDQSKPVRRSKNEIFSRCHGRRDPQCTSRSPRSGIARPSDSIGPTARERCSCC